MKFDQSQNQDYKKRKKIAAEWVAKNELGLSAHEQDEFNDWLTNNPENKEAYVSASRSWDELDRLLGLQSSYHAQPDPDLFAGENESDVFKPKNWNWLYTWFSAAASVILLLTALPLIHHQLNQESNVHFDRDEIVFNRIEKLNLEDGSQVTLNHGALVDPIYSETERVVKLIRGEALFDVEKDPLRPFIVEVSGVKIRAVGTAFNVKVLDNQVAVLVTEGIVSLNTNELCEEETEERFLEANYKATVTLNEDDPVIHCEQVDVQQIEDHTLWKPILLNFDDVPLSLIVDEFNRRNPQQLVLIGDGYERIRLTSYFWSDNVEGFLRLLEGKYGIQIVETEGDTYYLSNFIHGNN